MAGYPSFIVDAYGDSRVGHASLEDLLDLEPVFCELRKLPGISERSYGVLYFKRIPFLHFHTKDANRWADVKAGTTWGPKVPIPFRSGPRARQHFLKIVIERYKLFVSHE
jgi:hypothetical protein